MPDDQTQNYKNHAKFDPPFHFFLAPVALATVIICGMRMFRFFSFDNCWLFIFSLAFLACVFKTRIYALKVQNRVIRLEERIRMERVLPEPLRTRSRELTATQLIGLRFAPDSELPGLVEQSLTNNWTNKQIKQAIQNWRPDTLRV